MRLHVCAREPDLEVLLPIVRLIDDEAMSSDVTESPVVTDAAQRRKPRRRRVRRVQKDFVHPRITWLFHKVIDPRMESVPLDSNLPRGNAPRTRIREARFKSSKPAVVGMPLNFYNPVFYNGLGLEERRELQAAPPYDFSSAAHVLRGCRI